MPLDPNGYNFDAPGELERYMRDLVSAPAAPAAPSLTGADIQQGGMAINPATGQLQQAYATLAPNASGNMDWTDYSFDPTGRQSLAGWAPGYYTDNGGGLSDVLKSVIKNPAVDFFALTGGQGGATGAQLATGGDVKQGIGTDLAALAAASGISGANALTAPAAEAVPAAADAAAGATALPEVANVAGGLKVAPEATSLGSAIQGASTAGGVTGITPGTAAPGLVVPGITGMGTSGAIGTAGLGMGAGALGAELAATGAAPAIAGGTGVGSIAGPAAATAAGAGAAGVGATKLSDIANGNVGLSDIAGNATLGDLGKVAGTVGATAASVLANQQIADMYKGLADQYIGFGAPSRSRYEASFAPGFDITQDPALKSAMDASASSVLRGLSTQGNPYGNPGALAEANKYVLSNVALPYLNQYRNQNAATGGFGAFSTAAPGAAGSAINATGNTYSDIGRGIANLTNPPTDLASILKQMKGSGMSLSLT